MLGDAVATIKWMNRALVWSEFTPLELAEQDVEGLQMVLDRIGRIDAGFISDGVGKNIVSERSEPVHRGNR